MFSLWLFIHNNVYVDLSTCRPSAFDNNKDPFRVRVRVTLGLGLGLVWG